MPSARSGVTSSASSRLKRTNSPSVIMPSITIQPPTASTAATASAGTNASSGTYSERSALAWMLTSKIRSDRSRNCAVSRRS